MEFSFFSMISQASLVAKIVLCSCPWAAGA